MIRRVRINNKFLIFLVTGRITAIEANNKFSSGLWVEDAEEDFQVSVTNDFQLKYETGRC